MADENYLKAYLNIGNALRDFSDTNSIGLSERQLEYLITLGTYPEIPFTESQFAHLFRQAPSSASDIVKKMVSSGIFMKESESGHSRKARIKLTSKGNEVYEILSKGLVRATEEDAIGKKRPIF